VLVLALMLLPIWAVRIFPSSDGSAHLANADVLLHYFGSQGGAYREYYALNARPIPNAAGHFLLAALLSVLSPTSAEKMLVTLIVLLFPLSLGYACNAIQRGSAYLAWLALPLSIGFLLHQGFYNFCLGVCVALFFLGFWIKRHENLSPRRVMVLAGLGILLYLCHLFALIIACLGVAILAGWFTLMDCFTYGRENFRRAILPGLRGHFGWTPLALAPALLLAFLFRRFSGRPSATAHRSAWHAAIYWKKLAGLGILFSYRNAELWIAAGLAAIILIVAAIFLIRRFSAHRLLPSDALLLLTGALFVLYFERADDASTWVFIPERLTLFVWLGLVLWMAGQKAGIWHKRLLQCSACAAALALSVVHYKVYRDFAPQLDEYVDTARMIAPQSTVLPLLFNLRGCPSLCDEKPDRVTVLPFFMASGYATAELHAVDLHNYEAATDYFPVKFRAEVNPDQLLAVNIKSKKGFDRIPQYVDIAAYAQRSGGRARVDYVLIFAAPQFLDAKLRDDPATLAIQQTLNAGFKLIHTSDDAKVQLWRRND
jgi:hypothetical protein